MKLVIVESPAKARTISGFLGDDFVVESSIGHVRDIPAKAAEAPSSLQDEWRRTRYGVDVENDFKPLYVVSPDKKKQITRLRQLLKEAEELYLATDEDREGEAIAWHLLEVLNPRVPVRRMVFHEITEDAIQAAIDNPRDLDRRLVDAQEARRILDRLYGYELSPVLWRKVKQGLSAGRVQSPATRIIVEREWERIRFTPAEYFSIEAEMSRTEGDLQHFQATLLSVNDERIATGRSFDASGHLKDSDKVRALDQEAASALVEGLREAEFSVTSVEPKPYTRRPHPPFRTSTLQQEAGRKLRFAAARTMGAAQRLYENGYITYMRTDSTTLAEAALAAARELVREQYGAEYLPDKPRSYASKVKNAQEAHEAIRPAGDQFRPLADVANAVGAGSDEARLYDLIWKRTVASQMKDAKGESLQVRIGATAASGEATVFAASGRTITFPGFLRAYVEGSDDPEADLEDKERPLPPLSAGDALDAHQLEASGHETKPPARYTEASLVIRLEELGIGRPSTYASIISTIQDRGYVYKKGTALVPTITAFATVTLLERHFSDLIDYAFTARMEDDLDQIARGDAEAIPWLKRFYFGNGHPGLVELVSTNLEEIDAREINSIEIGKDAAGAPIVARTGRYGPYLQRGDHSASLPADIPLDELTVEKAVELLEAPSGDRELGTDPETGLTVYAKSGRYGPYVQLGDIEEGKKQKPKTASLFKTMSVETVTVEEALKLLEQPRLVGTDPEDSEEIYAQNGRYGPYIKKGTETRSLDEEEQIFSLTMEEALALLAQPKRGRRRAAKPPLKELGEDPNSGKPLVVKDGRYGPYVTDGETNASLRGADTVEAITTERAIELLAERRAKKK